MKKRVLSAFLCAMMIATMAVGCGSKDASKDAGSDDKGKIVVGGKSFTEAYLLSEIYADALEDNGYEVERVYDMNTDTISPAIQNGEIDMYPEYTGTALTDVLGLDMETDTDKVYESVSKGYEDKWNITWLDMTTMEDKVAIVMLKDKADELGVKNLTDLQKVADQLTLGDGVNFAEREDDLLRLNKLYGDFNFKVVNVDYSLAYSCLDDGTVDVIPGLTTDVQLLDDKYVKIEEDIPVWPPQYVAPIVRDEVLEKYPEMKDVLNNVSKHISTESMIEMLDEVINGGSEYEDVAADFYKENCK
ncbi:glycine betaine ABC transporter substrate-binding protein [Dorea formicigenerans]|jgi:osmoprotectant transport system substrate-binding protein|uniref:Glycine/betaine ABC transporter substrate-binding protein n=1 Tax=Dorea formicigenerans TaxID=39486 RepID=A0A3E4FAM3_9FIRM|nr:glycine betaine ABC transporter substrate-binding protein [Dorea formicigenerans]RGI86824.1 glycine/betaine ABC transporter substrate-binding protein [Dorea formicigenerans]RGI90001.1 glycine/betaine ABC transporter substrate-binding protein [Dorea formicigenerans]RHB40553.1 glycine/betaine ABC transporter substrate-binding protein [Dorea formicigenerans]